MVSAICDTARQLRLLREHLRRNGLRIPREKQHTDCLRHIKQCYPTSQATIIFKLRKDFI